MDEFILYLFFKTLNMSCNIYNIGKSFINKCNCLNGRHITPKCSICANKKYIHICPTCYKNICIWCFRIDRKCLRCSNVCVKCMENVRINSEEFCQGCLDLIKNNPCVGTDYEVIFPEINRFRTEDIV